MPSPFVILLSTLLVALPVLSSAAPAEDKGEALPPGALYRYHTEKGRLVITSVLPQEAIYLGYEIIDPSGRVLREVEKALPEEERRQRREELLARSRDAQLLKLYSTPDDAMRARDRQISAIRLNIDYATNTINQLSDKLSREVSAAATVERQGRPIPENMQATIDQYTRQIKEQEEQVRQYEADIRKLDAEFEPIISRLRQIKASR